MENFTCDEYDRTVVSSVLGHALINLQRTLTVTKRSNHHDTGFQSKISDSLHRNMILFAFFIIVFMFMRLIGYFLFWCFVMLMVMIFEHYITEQLAGLVTGCFPSLLPNKTQPIRREDLGTPTNRSPALAQVVGAGVGWGQFSWTPCPGCREWTENFVFSFRPIWCRMFIAWCQVNDGVKCSEIPRVSDKLQ